MNIDRKNFSDSLPREKKTNSKPAENILLKVANSQFIEEAEISEDSDDENLEFRNIFNDSSSTFFSKKMVVRIALIALLYYSLSISLTFYQKRFIQTYKLPLFVVSGHYVIKYILAIFIRFLYEFFNSPRMRVPFKEQFRFLAPIGICASMDIGLSNWALEYVTISLYTMAKSSSILFIVAFSLLLRLERWQPSLGLEATLIACGLFLFTWKSSQLDLTGLLLIELAAACTGVRWTVSQLVMQKDDSAVRHPLDMVAHLQPWMMILIVPLVWFFEGSELSWTRIFSFDDEFNPILVLSLIAGGGILAFCMEMSEYLLLVNTSGITLNLFGIVKEVATLLLAHYVDNDRFSLINVCGLLLCLTGMLLHGMNKRRQRSRGGAIHQQSNHQLPREDSRKHLLAEDFES